VCQLTFVLANLVNNNKPETQTRAARIAKQQTVTEVKVRQKVLASEMRAHSRDFRSDVRVPLFRLYFWRFYYVRTNVFWNLIFLAFSRPSAGRIEPLNGP
jgi:hypothetical protein